MPEVPLDVTGRPTALRDLDLDTFFHPKSVAVIGASDAGRRPNTAMWRKIRAWGEKAGASVYPVNPNKPEVDGVTCYPSIIDVPGDLDLAVILVGQAVEMFETVLEKKPRFAVIFAAGFNEVGPEGEALQKRLEDLIASGSTHLLGPNTNLNAFETFRDDLPGLKIALITQSGHQGRPVFQAQEQGIALSHWAPAGNEADLEFADFARYFLDQPDVGVVAAYIEGFKDGRTLMLAADHSARDRQADRVHQGGPHRRGPLDGQVAHRPPHRFRRRDLGGVPAVRRSPVSTASTSCTDVAAMFARTKRPKAKPGGKPISRGVAVYAISGGTGRPHGRPVRGRGPPAPRPREVDAEEAAANGYPAICESRTPSTAVERRPPTTAGRRS